MFIRAAVLGSLAACVAGAQAPVARGSSIRLVDFRPEIRTLLPGAPAVSSIILANDGSDRAHVWIGYSVQNPSGDWFDVPAREVSLDAHSRGAVETLEWIVPSNPIALGGAYRVVMAVWSAMPGSSGAERLVSADRRASFRVDAAPVAFGPGLAWHAGDHRLGRGRVLPDLVTSTGEAFRLRLPTSGCDGSEIRTTQWHHFGRFETQMRTPRAPGSISAFFLYADNPAGSDEIDIEIFNDGSRRALLSTWQKGKAGQSAEITLPFDPSEEAHRYAVVWSASEVELLVDDARVARWRDRIPRDPMRVMANVWWPTWLPCGGGVPGAELAVDWVRITAPALLR